MKDIEKRINEWIEDHTYAKGNDSDRYLPAIKEWGRFLAKTFYDEGRKDERESLDCFTGMHQEMCHRYVEASKRGDPESVRILEDIKAFERMMLEYMKAEMVGYEFVDRKYFDFVK